jgi:hypothetical protein
MHARGKPLETTYILYRSFMSLILCSYGDGCSSRNNLYTDVSPYIEWIESVVSKDTVCQSSSNEPEQTTVNW